MNPQSTQQAGSGDRALAGRSAIVTGSTSGIGLGIAQALAGAGGGEPVAAGAQERPEGGAVGGHVPMLGSSRTSCLVMR